MGKFPGGTSPGRRKITNPSTHASKIGRRGSSFFKVSGSSASASSRAPLSTEDVYQIGRYLDFIVPSAEVSPGAASNPLISAQRTVVWTINPNIITVGFSSRGITEANDPGSPNGLQIGAYLLTGRPDSRLTSGYVATNSATTPTAPSATVIPTNQAYTANQYSGHLVRIMTGKGAGQVAYVSSNTAGSYSGNTSVLTLSSALSVVPEIGDKFEIVGKVVKSSQSGFLTHNEREDRIRATVALVQSELDIDSSGDCYDVILLDSGGHLPLDSLGTTSPYNPRTDTSDTEATGATNGWTYSEWIGKVVNLCAEVRYRTRSQGVYIGVNGIGNGTDALGFLSPTSTDVTYPGSLPAGNTLRLIDAADFVWMESFLRSETDAVSSFPAARAFERDLDTIFQMGLKNRKTMMVTTQLCPKMDPTGTITVSGTSITSSTYNLTAAVGLELWVKRATDNLWYHGVIATAPTATSATVTSWLKADSTSTSVSLNGTYASGAWGLGATSDQSKRWFAYSYGAFLIAHNGNCAFEYRHDNPYVTGSNNVFLPEDTQRMFGRNYWRASDFYSRSDVWFERVDALGEPTEYFKSASAARFNGVADVYKRSFQNGIVLINNKSTSYTFSGLTSATYVNLDNQLFTSATSIAVPARSAMILLRATVVSGTYRVDMANGDALIINPTNAQITDVTLPTEKFYVTFEGYPVQSITAVPAATALRLYSQTVKPRAAGISDRSSRKDIYRLPLKPLPTSVSGAFSNNVTQTKWPIEYLERNGNYGNDTFSMTAITLEWRDLQSATSLNSDIGDYGARTSGGSWTAGNTVGKSTIDQAITDIRTWNAKANPDAQLRLLLRVHAGFRCPEIVKSTVGSFVYLDNGVGSSTPVAEAYTMPKWWKQSYMDCYEDLMTKLAALYDNVPEICVVVVSGTGLFYSEPFLRTVSSTTPIYPYASGTTYSANDVVAWQNGSGKWKYFRYISGTASSTAPTDLNVGSSDSRWNCIAENTTTETTPYATVGRLNWRLLADTGDYAVGTAQSGLTVTWSQKYTDLWSLRRQMEIHNNTWLKTQSTLPFNPLLMPKGPIGPGIAVPSVQTIKMNKISDGYSTSTQNEINVFASLLGERASFGNYSFSNERTYSFTADNATTADLPSSQWNYVAVAANKGVGDYLERLTTGTVAINGLTLSVGQRVLVKDQIASHQNGLYVVTSDGSGTSKVRLVRHTDFDTRSSADVDLYPLEVYIGAGSVRMKFWVKNTEEMYELTSLGAGEIGTTSGTMTFTKDPGGRGDLFTMYEFLREKSLAGYATYIQTAATAEMEPAWWTVMDNILDFNICAVEIIENYYKDNNNIADASPGSSNNGQHLIRYDPARLAQYNKKFRQQASYIYYS